MATLVTKVESLGWNPDTCVITRILISNCNLISFFFFLSVFLICLLLPEVGAILLVNEALSVVTVTHALGD